MLAGARRCRVEGVRASRVAAPGAARCPIADALAGTPRIDRRHDGLDLPGDELSLAEPDDRGPIEIVARPRIGVAYAGTWATRPPRFSIRGNAFVSRP